MAFSRPEYWSEQPFPSPRDLPNPGIKPRSPTLQTDSLPAESQGKPKNTGVGNLSLLQQIFPTEESNRGLLHCRQILYQLSYQGSPTPDEADAIITLPSSLKMTRAFPGGPVIKTSPSNAGDVGLIPGRGAEISHALWSKTNKQTNIKQKPYCNKFNKE